MPDSPVVMDLVLLQEAAVKASDEAVAAAGQPSSDRQQPWGQRISHAQHIEQRRLAKTFPRYVYLECTVRKSNRGRRNSQRSF